MSHGVVYSLSDVVKCRRNGDLVFELHVPNMRIMAGDQIALTGASGCGKSTLLDMLAMTLRPDTARQFVFITANDQTGVDIHDMWQNYASNNLGYLRGRYIGYVLQTGGLLSFLNVTDNIYLSRRLIGLEGDGRVPELVEALGIANHLHRLPSQLSVGERQRVAIVRALAHEPKVVIADEPTASVDPDTAIRIMEILFKLTKGMGVTTIMASHDWDLVDSFGLRRVHNTIHREGAHVRSMFEWS